MNKLYKKVSARANFVCEYCRAPESAFNFPFELDHYVPLSKGGTDDLDNLVLACRACNAYKAFHNLGLHDDDKNLPLFNPRFDNWENHFRCNLKTFEIIGLTNIGVGTINRLKMNSPLQIKARRFWKKFNLFP